MNASNLSQTQIAFIGGGNMAAAIIGGLQSQGLTASQLCVVEPFAPTRERLQADFGITAHAEPNEALSACAIVVWAVKPQIFKEACTPVREWVPHALHLSVAAGIPSQSIATWLGTERIVRAMPNTPALIQQGMTGLYARDQVSASERSLIEALLASTGDLLWFDVEAKLDAVTAISGSGPAYVFYFLEALVAAGQTLGLSEAQSKQLALQTFSGATALAKQSSEPLAQLRERVTSKGGTTYAALTSMESAKVKSAIEQAAYAAHQRAAELGLEFGV